MSIDDHLPPNEAAGAAAPMAFSIDDATRIMGISRATLFREINRGRLPAVKVGRKTLITRAGINNWLASLPVRSTAAA